jgi:hypothetical protein
MTTEPDPAAPQGSPSGSDEPSGADAAPPPVGPEPAAPPPTAPPAPAPYRPWTPPPSSGPPSSNRGAMIFGVILILLGALFLAERVLDINLGRYGWPLFILVPGVLLFLAALAAPAREGAGLATAAGIVTMVGLVLAVQNATDAWATWAYAWALVAPGGVGLGLALYGVIRGLPDLVSAGLRSLGAGLGLFVGFGLFFEGVIGLSGDPFLVGSDYLPIALIGIGVVFLVLGVLRGRRTT